MRFPRPRSPRALLAALVFAAPAWLGAQSLGASGGPQPNLAGQLERPLRYRPGTAPDSREPAFVIENGAEFFNRPLYGGNTAFRVDAGDRPEFALYLPGRGGNLRLGFRTTAGAKWLHACASITAYYVPGEMEYVLRDPLLGDDVVLRVAARALVEAEGVVVRAATQGKHAPLELLWAYGGVTGQRGRRDGDIGTESVPIAQYFQLQPEFCRDNRIAFGGRGAEEGTTTFTLTAKPGTIAGVAFADQPLARADAQHWGDCTALLKSAAENPTHGPLVVVGRQTVRAGELLQVALQRLPAPAPEEPSTYREMQVERPDPLPASAATSPQPSFDVRQADGYSLWENPGTHFRKLRRRVAIETPDPFLDLAVASLNVAADAVWDEPQQAIMHGAIAWRTKLLGWRGPYALDALGWHDRARRHFRSWAARQNTSPIPDRLPPPEEATNLARSRTALHSNGNLSDNHYDMNLVYFDALFRHLRWTGDLELARELWPVIERHLAWERRLFRREFTTATGEKLPLYEAYAAIWASDDLQYHGGGTAHASAYNYWHHTMAAELAAKLGRDPAPYAAEAALIARGLRELLWVPERGVFAEFKDFLGKQLVHPSAALWSVYHVIDSELPTPDEALAMTRYVERELPRLPVLGPGVPAEFPHAMYASSNWLPYTWSINNVVMGENVHTALAFWQAGRADEAYRLARSSLLASMYLGICPGNVGSMNYLDVYRRESQRDFADGSGVTARAIVEGLFGVQRDALNGELRIRPGFPSGWKFARLEHPDCAVRWLVEEAVGAVSPYPAIEIQQPAATALPVRVELPVDCEVRKVWVATASKPLVPDRDPEVRAGEFTIETSPTGVRRVVVTAPAAARVRISIFPGHVSDPTAVAAAQRRAPPSPAVPAIEAASVASESPDFDWSARAPVAAATLAPVDLAPHFNDRVTAIFAPGKYRSPRSPFASLALPAQGIGAWAGHVNETAEIDDAGLRRVAGANAGKLALPNGVAFATPGPGDAPNVLFVSQWDNYPREATVPLAGAAKHLFLLMAGSTNWMQSRLDNAEVIATYADGTTARLALRNPETWWPIDQDFFIDDYQFAVAGPLPPRVNLKTGEVRVLDRESFKGKGRKVPGGAATVLHLPLDPTKELKSLTVRALANEVVIGLLAATLER